jgi:hypothetical protein
MKNVLTLTVLFLFVASHSYARDIELFSVENRLVPYSEVENRPDAEIQPEYTRVRVAFPPVRFADRQGLLAPSLSYENLHFNYRGANAIGDAARVDTLHGVQLSFFYTQPLRRPHWSVRSFMISGLRSDFEAVTWAAFGVQGGIIFEHAKNNQNIGLGVVVVDNYGRTMPFPAFSYEALVAQHHRFSVRAPTQVSWFYVPNEKWEAGLAMRINGGSYRLEEPGLFHGKTARYSIGTFGPSLLMRPGSRLTLTLETGTVFRHKFGIYDDRTEFRDYDLTRSYFVSAGLGFRLGRK